ncbi:MAG: polyprenyl synthetase family protein [bacterium]|nr:polyprenyl synthetase family protein [bacterium]
MRLRDGELDIALERVDRRIREVVAGSDRMVLQYIADIGTSRGKRIRPRLMIAVAGMFGGAPAGTLANCAACCELLHTASLIHDDVIDEAPTRRGSLTLSNMYGNEIAVVVGDYLLALVLRALNSERDHKLVDMLLGTSQELGMGVIEEVLNRNNFVLSVEKYYDIIYLKTASLFSLCCELGAYLGGSSTSEPVARPAGLSLAQQYGKHLGLAFQVVDDLLDLTADSASTGKPAMNDVREGRITLPVIHALLEQPQRTKGLVEACQTSGDAASAGALKAHLAQLGSVRFAYGEAKRLLAEAHAAGVELARAAGAETADAAAELARLEGSVIGVLGAARELAG